MLKVTIESDNGSGTWVLEFPADGETALNNYAKTIFKDNPQEVIVSLLNDQLMTQNVIPRTPVPPDLQVEIDLIKAEADAAVAQLNEKRVEPYKPILTIDGTPTPLSGQGK